MADLKTHIASLSTLGDQHRAGIIDPKRELDRLQNMMADYHSENARRRRLAQDRERARNVAIADRDLAVAYREEIRANLAQLASGVPFDVVSAPVFTDNKHPRSGTIFVSHPSVLGLQKPPIR